MSYSTNFAPVTSTTAACYTTINPNQAASGSPARMADGRIMTDYRPRCLQYATAANQAWGDNDARIRMTHGADELMNVARQVANRKNTATRCVDTMVPELYKRVCTWKGCKTIPGNFQGIGSGRIYVPSASDAANDPQTLSDISIPRIPSTFSRQPPRMGSHCAINDPETTWSIKGPAASGSSAKSHPYSAPRA